MYGNIELRKEKGCMAPRLQYTIIKVIKKNANVSIDTIKPNIWDERESVSWDFLWIQIILTGRHFLFFKNLNFGFWMLKTFHPLLGRRFGYFSFWSNSFWLCYYFSKHTTPFYLEVESPMYVVVARSSSKFIDCHQSHIDKSQTSQIPNAVFNLIWYNIFFFEIKKKHQKIRKKMRGIVCVVFVGFLAALFLGKYSFYRFSIFYSVYWRFCNI